MARRQGENDIHPKLTIHSVGPDVGSWLAPKEETVLLLSVKENVSVHDQHSHKYVHAHVERQLSANVDAGSVLINHPLRCCRT